ncbi:hypothetical protein K438DRAFT_1805827 [Mycena galopus ATCC 62051]|nr:hypothetical protein K438DRAFT_1805827 [Mycena galopus ATCC 62051]
MPTAWRPRPSRVIGTGTVFKTAYDLCFFEDTSGNAYACISRMPGHVFSAPLPGFPISGVASAHNFDAMALKPSISCHSFVQSKIVATINSDAYHAHLLTPLSDEAWDSISDDSDRSALENRRMEWVGDGIIAGRITSMLYYMFSKADVEFYHVARDCLVSNSTFKHLMRKICAATAVACPASKISADVFETMVGALYKEHYKNGLEHKFNAWIDDIFMPLTEAAELAFRVYRKINSYKKKKTGPKRVVHKAVLQDIRNQQLLKERRKERARLANISLEQNRLRLLQKYNVRVPLAP